MSKRWLIPVCLVAAQLVAIGCGAAKAPRAELPAEYRSVRMVGSSVGGKLTTAAMVLATVLDKYYPGIEWSSVSGNSGTNPIYITTGQIKLGMAGPGNYIDAFGYEKIGESRLRSLILPTPANQYLFLVPEDKPWQDITQVPRGLTLSPGTAGTGLPICAEAWLKLSGLSKKDFNWVPMGKTETADAWRAGKIDLTFQNVDSVAPWLTDMGTSPRKFKAMGLSPEQADKATKEGAFERIGFSSPVMSTLTKLVPEFFKSDVICPQQPIFMDSRDDFPDEIAYKMAKIWDEHKADMLQMYSPMKYASPEAHTKWAKPPTDIHPGVAKYYREKGYLK